MDLMQMIRIVLLCWTEAAYWILYDCKRNAVKYVFVFCAWFRDCLGYNEFVTDNNNVHGSREPCRIWYKQEKHIDVKWWRDIQLVAGVDSKLDLKTIRLSLLSMSEIAEPFGVA